jgi:hypothetical protein
MHSVMAGALLNVLLAAGMSAAMPAMPPLAQVLDFCGSTTMPEAAAKGDQLGWRRMTDAEIEPWRTGFAATNGGPVEVLGWRRGDNDRDDSLSFWVAHGPNRHKACSYAATNPARLLDDLSERFGAPSNLEKSELATTAAWKLGAMEVSFSQVGSRALIYVIHSD